MTFGEKIQKLRKEAGMSQEELAYRLGVSRQPCAFICGFRAFNAPVYAAADYWDCYSVICQNDG